MIFLLFYYKIKPMNIRIRKIVENIKNSPAYKGKLRTQEPMSLHTTMKAGGSAAVFAEPQDIASLALLAAECRGSGADFFILGGGSNLIVRDSGFDGVIISMNSFSSIELKDGIAVCGAGALTADVVRFFAENGIPGMEVFAGLPGTCGGACFMNARCYSADISSRIDSVEYLDTEKIGSNAPAFLEQGLKIYHNTGSSMDWSYKHSPFMGGSRVITKVMFKAGKPDSSRVSDIRAECEHFIQDREAKGHFKAPSSGSIFKNSRSFGCPSGMLIDRAGLKGTRIGGAQIAPWHGNIIINTGNATCADIQSLVHLAQEKVQKQTGFLLECEVIFL